MNILQNVRTWIRAILERLFGPYDERSASGVYMVRDAEESEEGAEVSRLTQTLLGLPGGERGSKRKASAEDEALLSRIRELKTRDEVASKEFTKHFLKARRLMYQDGVDRPGIDFIPPEQRIEEDE